MKILWSLQLEHLQLTLPHLDIKIVRLCECQHFNLQRWVHEHHHVGGIMHLEQHTCRSDHMVVFVDGALQYGLTIQHGLM